LIQKDTPRAAKKKAENPVGFTEGESFWGGKTFSLEMTGYRKIGDNHSKKGRQGWGASTKSKKNAFVLPRPKSLPRRRRTSLLRGGRKKKKLLGGEKNHICK